MIDIIAASEFVVQLALLIISVLFESFSSFAPKTIVSISPLLVGPEITTFFAPAVMCILASSLLVNLPVDSITTSTSSSFQGRDFGSFSAVTGIL